jgi:alpha-galactosidase
MKRNLTSRRRFLQWAGLAVGAGAGPRLGLTDSPPAGAPVTFGDASLLLSFDEHLHSSVARIDGAKVTRLTQRCASEYLQLAGGASIGDFALRGHSSVVVRDEHGVGSQLTLTGVSAGRIEKTVRVTLWKRYPGFALYRVTYRNLSAEPLAVRSWTNGAAVLLAKDTQMPQFWSYSGGTYEDRRDWVQPIKTGFAQGNYMGMNASDYGGGTPIVDVWRRDGGVALGHVETAPRLVSLPIKERGGSVCIELNAQHKRVLAPGESLETLETFLAVHRGDYFAVLDQYRRLMGERGLRAAQPPEASYEPIWCAWGYERDCTVALIEKTLPKVKELGLSWAVIDDGWQNSVGDWNLNKDKFPRGEADMASLVGRIKDEGLKPRLWYAPLAAAPGSDVLHDHTDMLLLDKDGAPQIVSWWNSLYLCPAYPKTLDYTVALVRKFIGEWGYAGLKVDGQHLNGVAPCFNPAHHHSHPEESLEKLPDFFRAIYTAATQINPAAVVELCPCGTAYSFYDFPFINQAPASDPETSWQVRLKGKTLKALMGPSAPFAGDHVELSDRGDDFASTVGIGAVVSTKFTWPEDPKPKDSFLLTPEREKEWRKWIALYNEKKLSQGTYRGDLYDIGFDKPETHAILKSGRIYYSFYAPKWQGAVQLRGLESGTYRVRDYFNDRDLGTVSASDNSLHVAFEHFLLIEAEPA